LLWIRVRASMWVVVDGVCACTCFSLRDNIKRHARAKGGVTTSVLRKGKKQPSKGAKEGEAI
jgi:hypothetical protein